MDDMDCIHFVGNLGSRRVAASPGIRVGLTSVGRTVKIDKILPLPWGLTLFDHDSKGDKVRHILSNLFLMFAWLKQPEMCAR